MYGGRPAAEQLAAHADLPVQSSAASRAAMLNQALAAENQVLKAKGVDLEMQPMVSSEEVRLRVGSEPAEHVM